MGLKLMTRAAAPSSTSGKPFTMEDLDSLINDKIYKEWNMFSICDLVYNHMANESEFLVKCPQATFNMANSPHLIPAFVMDRAIYHVTEQISRGDHESRGLPASRFDQSCIEPLRHQLRHVALAD